MTRVGKLGNFKIFKKKKVFIININTYKCIHLNNPEITKL